MLRDSDKRELCKKARCEHQSNGFLCERCRYNPKRFLARFDAFAEKTDAYHEKLG